MTGGKQQDDEDSAVDDPQDIQSEVEPQGQADLLLESLRGDIGTWFTFISNLNTRADNQ